MADEMQWQPCPKKLLLLLFMLPLIVLLSGFWVSLNPPRNSNKIYTISSPRNHSFLQLSPLKFFDHITPSSSNSSSSSSSTIQTQKNITDFDGGQPDSINSSDILPHPDDRLNGTGANRSRRKYTNLERLEATLTRARLAIKQAKVGNGTKDPDYIPNGPMYWNPNAFHRSYLEMEKHFKIYVYEEGDPPVFHSSRCDGILGMEGMFINDMEISPFRTRDPEKAHVFFLPFSIVSIVHYVYIVDSHDWNAMKNTAKDYVSVVSQKYPYWNRSHGADHFMLACHDWGPEISKAVPLLFNTSIRALCNANTSEAFRPWKDVSIPEIYLPGGTMEGLLDGPGPSLSDRPILVFFAGGIHGDIRAVLLEHWENKDKDVQVHQYLPKNVSYYDQIRKSRFCICASGYEVASPRMVEALYAGCVPVLLKDDYAKPFADVLDWKTFSVDISSSEIPMLKKILTGISESEYVQMQRRGVQVRKHFEVNLPPKRYDVFHMILHSIWLRRLNVRIHDNGE